MRFMSLLRRPFVTALVVATLVSAVHAGPGTPHADIKLTFDDFLLPNAALLINDTPMLLSVDTGSSFAFHLTPEQIEAIGAKPSTQTRQTIDAAGNTQVNTLYAAENLNLNGIALREAQIVPLQQWGLMMRGEGEPPDAPVIGLGAFADSVLVLDYKRKRMRIAPRIPDEWLADERFIAYPFIHAPEGLVFNVEHAGRAYRLILDSGASVSAIWNERLAESTRESCALINPEIDDAGCEAVRLSAVSSQGVRDAFMAIAVPGRFSHMEDIDGLLGNNFLNTRTVIVDFPNKRVWVSGPST